MPVRSQLPVFAGSSWLLDLIDYAVTSGACLKPGCTTCGSMPFREAVQAALNIRVDDRPDTELNELIDQVRRFRFGETDTGAVKLLLMSISSGEFGPMTLDDLQDRLVATDAASMLSSMRQHHESVQLERRQREAEQAPEAVEARRALKRQAGAERHRARMTEKAAREATPEWKQRYGHLRPEPPSGSR